MNQTSVAMIISTRIHSAWEVVDANHVPASDPGVKLGSYFLRDHRHGEGVAQQYVPSFFAKVGKLCRFFFSGVGGGIKS